MKKSTTQLFQCSLFGQVEKSENLETFLSGLTTENPKPFHHIVSIYSSQQLPKENTNQKKIEKINFEVLKDVLNDACSISHYSIVPQKERKITIKSFLKSEVKSNNIIPFISSLKFE